jgi:hypothetical protein
MAVLIDGTTPRTFDGGMTAKEMLQGFVNVRTAGAREFAERLERAATAAGRDAQPLMLKAALAAGRPIAAAYKAKINKVTGNLSKSVAVKKGKNQYPGVAIAVVGPQVTGAVGADPEKGSGNHAWLLEFGTGPRKPGTQGRRTYVNVHQAINGKMSRAGTFNNEQFERMGRGYYFLMGSKNEPTRRAKMGSGYPHDFGSVGGKMFPVRLGPGEALAPMPAQHPMEKAISETSSAALATLIAALEQQIRDI